MAATHATVSSPTVKAFAGLIGLQILFAIVILAVTSAELNPGGNKCYLNLLSGSVCDFVYTTGGFSLFFSLLMVPHTVATLRGGAGSFLQAIYGSLSIFAAFWWMVCAITITIRGGQASDAGYQSGTARNAVIGLSWVQMVLFLAGFVAVVYDRIAFRQYRTRLDRSRTAYDLEQRAEFKQQYAATQVLGSTPLA